ncbi:MAG: TetR/AcrR family transcriptional regulator [Pseudomonadales bacterium]|jgi:AcrR family transcriptional regulator|nr:TetR/AcrR family transcriptional regulator [Pseudomonadales bacterium]
MDAVLPSSEQGPGDPRILRSEAAISSALLALLGEGLSFDALTVSAVAEHAGVTRKTFYARFGSLERVVHRIVADLLGALVADLDDDLLRLPRTDPAVTTLVFAVWDAHREVLAPLLTQCPAGLFLAPVSEVADRFLDRVLAVNAAPALEGARRDYLIAVVASVMHGMLSVWVRRDFSEPPEAVAALMDRLLGDGVERFLLAGAS